jgi:glycosyltransferase involved in cell wall biosynthesis
MAEPLSVTIITFNAGEQLAACLRSVSFADEIVVADSGSNDATLEMARNAGAVIVHQDWLGFGKQKQFAVTKAKYDWVLCIDADEQVSDALRISIQRELEAPRFYAYQMPRCNRFMGKWLRHGEGYPDLSLRLFHRAYAAWSDDSVHEKAIAQTPAGRLKGDLLHESETSIESYLDKQNRYTSLQAQTLYGRGKHANILRLLFSPPLRFIKFYLFRLGFMDGIPGLVHILIGCSNSFIKYAKLIALSGNKN